MIQYNINIKTFGQSGSFTFKDTDNVQLVDFITSKANAMGVNDCDDLIKTGVQKYLTVISTLLTAKGDHYEAKVVNKLNICTCLIVIIKSIKKS